jgi:hypothetical protein
VSKTIAIDLMESKINRIIDIIRSLKEEGEITNAVGNGEKSLGFNIQNGTPPVNKTKIDLRKKKGWNPFFKDLARMQRRNPQP